MWRCESFGDREWPRFAWLMTGMVLVTGLMLTSCGGAPMELDEWQQRWQQVTDDVDDTFTETITSDGCENALGYLREQRPDLTPTPLADLRAPVTSWFETAEDLFFECDFAPGQGKPETLQVLEAEVEIVISLER